MPLPDSFNPELRQSRRTQFEGVVLLRPVTGGQLVERADKTRTQQRIE